MEKFAAAFAISHTDCAPWGENAAEKSQRTYIPCNIGGDAVRVRFSNAYGREPLVIGAARISAVRGGDTVFTAPLRFGGDISVTIAPPDEIASDTLDVKICARDTLVVEVFFPKQTAPVSGNSTADSFTSGANGAGEEWRSSATFGLSGVDVLTERDAGVIVCFGDSITQMRRWTLPLQRKLYADYPDKLTLVNAGIGGNRLLHDTGIPNVGRAYGDSGLKRLARDALSLGGVRALIVSLGVNDLGHPGASINDAPLHETVSVEDMKRGYTELAAHCREKGVRVFGATITPFGTSAAYTAEREDKRAAINEWILKTDAFDGAFDFARAVCDVSAPHRMMEKLCEPDGLHPNIEGGARLMESIDIDRLVRGIV